MPRPKTEYRNELKIRVTDEAYTALKALQKKLDLSESRAGAACIEGFLFGMVGTIPEELEVSSPKVAHFGTLIRV